MKKIILGCDLDGVLALFNKGFLPYVNRRYGTNFQPKDISCYSYFKTLKLDRDQVSELFASFVAESGFKYLSPDIEMVQVFKRVLRKYRGKVTIQFITARGEDLKTYRVDRFFFAINKLRAKIRRETKDWVKKQGFNASVAFRKDKGLFCKQNKVDILVEDCLENAVSVAKTETEVILITKPWNNDKNKDNKYIRANTYKEVERKLEEIINKRLKQNR